MSIPTYAYVSLSIPHTGDPVTAGEFCASVSGRLNLLCTRLQNWDSSWDKRTSYSTP